VNAPAPGDPVHLLHWNVHSWIDPVSGKSNAEAVTRLIREYQPDVVSLVEVDETWSQPSTLARAAESCGYTATFVPTFEYGSNEPVGGFGNAILSRLPVQAVKQHQLTWPTTVYDGTEPSEPRSVLLVTVRTPSGGELCIGSTHLPRSDALPREQALARLTGLVTNLRNPWVICGDFNTPASTWVDSGGRFAVAPSREQPTYPVESPTEGIDYAVAGPGISLSAELLAVGGSDHMPVLVTLRRCPGDINREGRHRQGNDSRN
jgi:endonuclease/exonuclease/phosphatase family metal-dependent hydrolase